MKRFLQDIGLSIVVALIFFGALEFGAESIPNSYSYKRNYMEHHVSEIQTLILGSSYAYDGLAPSELPHAFNLANSSQTIEDDYRLLARYIDAMDSLRTVILGVGYASLGEISETHRRTYYTIYMDLYQRWPINRYSFEVFHLELLTKKMIKYIVSQDITRCDSLGQRLGHDAAAVAQQSEFWNKDLDALIATDRMVMPGGLKTALTNSHYLDSLASVCAKRGGRLVIVSMPAQANYIVALPAEQVALHDSIYAAPRPNTLYINASCWPVPSNGWYNATHLTREASLEFTRHLSDSIW